MPRRLDCTSRVCLRQSRPPGKIINGRRASSGEITGRELCQRSVAFQLLRRWDTLLEQCIRELLVATGTAADESVQLGVHHEMRQSLSAGCLDARVSELRCHLGARQLVSVTEGLLEHRISVLSKGNIGL